MNKELFIKELKNINIDITKEQETKLDKYYHLLYEENKKYNLTSITDEEQVYLKHFYDSLTISKIIDLNNQKLCDIGTGAGFPGIVLKIIFPDLSVTLVESNTKKCDFLNKVILELQLNKIKVINERAEIYSKSAREEYDIVTSRAVAPLKHLLEYSIPLIKVNGYYIAMKSDISKEIVGIEVYEKKLKIEKVKEKIFYLPIEKSLRTLIMYQKKEKTDLKYPRKYSDIKKKSL